MCRRLSAPVALDPGWGTWRCAVCPSQTRELNVGGLNPASTPLVTTLAAFVPTLFLRRLMVSCLCLRLHVCPPGPCQMGLALLAVGCPQPGPRFWGIGMVRPSAASA